VLRAKVDSPTYSARYYDPRDNTENFYPVENVPYLKFSAVHNAEGGYVTLFALNRHLTQAMTMNVDLKGFADLEVVEAHQLHHADLKAANTATAPSTVTPTAIAGIEVRKDKLSVELGPASWNVIRLAGQPT
jgi:alpha-N-arabinofuranosidase